MGNACQPLCNEDKVLNVLDNFKWGGKGVPKGDVTNDYVCALCSYLAYEDKKTFFKIFKVRGEYLLGNEIFRQENYVYFSHDESSVHILYNEKYLLLSFRGSDEKRIWKDSVCINFEYDDPVLCHKGMLESISCLMKDAGVWKYIQKKINSKRKLWIMGHSIGGGLATLAAYYIGYKKLKAVDRLCTFGSPAVGDKYFVSRVNKLTERGYIARYQHIDDLVPDLLGWITKKNKLRKTEPYHQTVGLTKILRDGSLVRKKPETKLPPSWSFFEGIQKHSSAEYLNALKQCVPETDDEAEFEVNADFDFENVFGEDIQEAEDLSEEEKIKIMN